MTEILLCYLESGTIPGPIAELQNRTQYYVHRLVVPHSKYLVNEFPTG